MTNPRTETTGRGSEGVPARPDWMVDLSRSPWVTNILNSRAKEMRQAEARCRTAFTQPYMGEPAEWLADCYRDAAEHFERCIRAVKIAQIIRHTNNPSNPEEGGV